MKGMLRHINWFVILLIMIVLHSCGDSVKYEHQYLLNDQAWQYNKPFQFQFEVDDTTRGYDLLINLSYKKAYAYSNLYLFVDVEDSNKKAYRDTINCFLSDYAGRFYGDVSGEDVEQDLLYRQKIVFPNTGIYTISLQQAMRDSSLQNINSVGLSIKQYKP